MTTHLGLQRILLPTAQVSSLTTGSITLPSARGAFAEPGDYESIASVTPSGSGQINFTSIPQTYTHLQIRFFGKDNPIGDQISLNIGSGNTIDTTSNYSFHVFGATGSGTMVFNGAPNNSTMKIAYGAGLSNGSSQYTNIFDVYIIDILDYANTNKYKTIRSIGGYCGGAGNMSVIDFVSGALFKTPAINCLRFGTNNFGSIGTVALYGIKGS